MILLKGKPIANKIKSNLMDYISKNNLTGKYVSIIFVGNNPSCKVYVDMKRKFGLEVGIDVQIRGHQDRPLQTVEDILARIEFCNQDDDCIGILVQLPMFDRLTESKSKILSSVVAHKDIDGLGGVAFGLSTVGEFEFFPATVGAVINLLRGYDLGDLQGKAVSIIGQSNLVGKSLAIAMMNMGATVFSFNADSNPEFVKQTCKMSDYIISCTGVLHLVDSSFVNSSGNQILVDVGRGTLDGKPAGDIDFKNISDKVGAISPVPGGVGPLTIASLFDNIRILREYYNTKKVVF